MTNTGDDEALAQQARTTEEDDPLTGDAQWVAARIDRSRYRTGVELRAHRQVLDEPADKGGTDAGPTPEESFLGALAACMVITLRMYADRKGWPLDGAHVRLRMAEDGAAGGRATTGPQVMRREITLEGALSDEQRQRLLQIADRCPVKRIVERGVVMVDR